MNKRSECRTLGWEELKPRNCTIAHLLVIWPVAVLAVLLVMFAITPIADADADAAMSPQPTQYTEQQAADTISGGEMVGIVAFVGTLVIAFIVLGPVVIYLLFKFLAWGAGD